jgi:hypothetical protein
VIVWNEVFLPFPSPRDGYIFMTVLRRIYFIGDNRFLGTLCKLSFYAKKKRQLLISDGNPNADDK